jgi:hypothetical protein
MHFDYMMRNNPVNDVMANMISSDEEINSFLDLLEIMAMYSAKSVHKRFD